MGSRFWQYAALAGASFYFGSAALLATPQVVGDEACERHEVDIASFASCIEGKVVKPAPDTSEMVGATAATVPRGLVYFELEPRHRATLVLAGMARDTDTWSGGRKGGIAMSNCVEAPQAATLVSAQIR